MLQLSMNKQLENLQSWQQSVFCMALAQHTILHFHMFSEATGSDNGKIVDTINQLFWEKMTVRGAKINFTIQQENFEAIIPDSRDFDFYGVYPAIDYCVIMSCAFNSFLSKSKDEAINASQTSFSTIASFIELQNDAEIDETELQDSPIFQEEVAFQEMLLTMLDKERSPEVIKSIQQAALEYGKTNIGIALNE